MSRIATVSVFKADDGGELDTIISLSAWTNVSIHTPAKAAFPFFAPVMQPAAGAQSKPDVFHAAIVKYFVAVRTSSRMTARDCKVRAMRGGAGAAGASSNDRGKRSYLAIRAVWSMVGVACRPRVRNTGAVRFRVLTG